jgi:hypothetical protein
MPNYWETIWQVYGTIILIIFFVGIPLYFIPSFIAFKRNHEKKWFIFLLNFLMGATGIGYVAAFIWACTGSSSSYRVKYRKSKKYRTSYSTLNDETNLYYLDPIHIEFFKVFNKLPAHYQVAVENEMKNNKSVHNLSRLYDPCLFSSNTADRKHFVEENFYNLFIYLMSYTPQAQQQLLERMKSYKEMDVTEQIKRLNNEKAGV